MADFCNKCADEMFGEDASPDIHVESIATGLEPGYYMPVLCEGCVMRMIVKEEDGTVKIGYDSLDDSDEFVFETLEEYLRKDSTFNREPLR